MATNFLNIVLLFIIVFALFSNCQANVSEGFVSSDNNSKDNEEIIDQWTSDAEKYSETNMHQDHLIKNQTYSGKNNFKKDSDLFFLTETVAKPECCPSAYSNSSGCLCMTPEQNNFLDERGENRSYGDY